MKSIIFLYSSYGSMCRLKETLVGWERSAEQQREGYSPSLVDTLRSLKEEIVSCKVDNE